MAWTEVDAAVTSPAESGITATVMTADVIRDCNNLPPQHPHYSKILTYINEAKDEAMTLMLSTHHGLLDLMPRLRNWRWYDTTLNGQEYLVLPDTMLTLESVTYTKSTAAYTPSTVQEFPSFEEPDPVLFGQYPKSATGWPVRYRRQGARLNLWRTPSFSASANYLTQVVIRGTRRLSDLVSGSDTFPCDVKLHRYIQELAVVIAMEHMGWDDASQKRQNVESRLQRYRNVTADEGSRRMIRTEIQGTPR